MRQAADAVGLEDWDRAARRALQEFGFDDSAVTGFERLPRGIKNLNYRVRAGADDWVLKCHPGADMLTRRTLTHAVEIALGDAGVPVAGLRRSVTGSTVVTTEAGVYTMHRWVEGQQISIAQRDATHALHPRLADDLGEVLGTIHRQSGTEGQVFTARALLEGPRRSVGSIRRGPPHRLRKVARLRLKAAKSEFDTWMLDALPSLYREAAALASPAVWSALAEEDLVLDHHDLNWENLVLDSEFRLVAVLDFDNASVVPRALAVGSAAAVLVGPDPDRLDQFVTAYSRVVGDRPDPWAVNVGMHLKCLQSTLRSIDAHLSGRVVEPRMLETWCRHLQACRLALPAIGTR